MLHSHPERGPQELRVGGSARASAPRGLGGDGRQRTGREKPLPWSRAAPSSPSSLGKTALQDVRRAGTSCVRGPEDCGQGIRSVSTRVQADRAASHVTCPRQFDAARAGKWWGRTEPLKKVAGVAGLCTSAGRSPAGTMAVAPLASRDRGAGRSLAEAAGCGLAPLLSQ